MEKLIPEWTKLTESVIRWKSKIPLITLC